MGIRVALAVPIRPRHGNQPVERAFDVAGDIRVRAFIDRGRCGRVRHIQIAKASGHTGRSNRLLNLRGHIHKLRAAVRLHTQCLHEISSPTGAGILACSNRSEAEAFFFLSWRSTASPLFSKDSAECHSERSEESAFHSPPLWEHGANTSGNGLRKLNDEVMPDFLSRRKLLQFAESACPPSRPKR